MNKYLIALSYIENLGPITLQKILNHLTAAEAWVATAADFKKIGLGEKIIDSLISQRQKINPDKISEQIAKEKIKVLTLFDNDYPSLLKEIYAPPVVLYYRGKLAMVNQQITLAVVGTRKISNYAKLIMPGLLEPLIDKGVMIISGLAYGVDALAHQIAIANRGVTVAVLGSGLAWDYLYPKSNKNLVEKIIQTGGAIISEFPPFITAQPFNFPRRNRIISGLSQATLIIEAGEKSGALITAHFALEQNREVLVVPGNINQPTSAGCNELIKSGAKTVTRVEDIFDSLNIYYQISPRTKINLAPTSPEEQLLLKTLSSSPMTIDKIIEHCTLETSIINATLLQMELKGWIKNLGGQNYVKI